jgi:uncharacterized protein (TIGR03032 family)
MSDRPTPPGDGERVLYQRVVPGRPPFQLLSGRDFVSWMTGEGLSLALSTYHAGAVLLLGRRPDNEAALYVSAFDRAMGLWSDGQTLWLATTTLLWRLENCLAPGVRHLDFDRMYVPREGRVTGDLDIHDLAAGGDGRPVFVNTRFNCLATLDDRFSFAPLWQPPFISALVPEDRCHLNGLALEDGRPKYVTAVARSDVADGWRDFRGNGGLVLDVTSNAVVAEGLSMPHSPRLYRGRLWVLNSGTGHFGYIDLQKGAFEPVAFLPGYARGLAFHGNYAVIGLSKPRREHAFQGLPLDRNLAERGAVPRCGLCVVELATGAVVQWLRLEGGTVEELYDVAVLPGSARAKALGPSSPEVGQQFCCAQSGRVFYWSAAPSAATGPQPSPGRPA